MLALHRLDVPKLVPLVTVAEVALTDRWIDRACRAGDRPHEQRDEQGCPAQRHGNVFRTRRDLFRYEYQMPTNTSERATPFATSASIVECASRGRPARNGRTQEIAV